MPSKKAGPKRCELKTSKTYRMRNTPSYVAKDCPYLLRTGKDKGREGRSRIYQSLPYWQCSSRTNPACKYIWRWVGEPI